MSIKLKGSTAGSVALDAPANTSPSGSDIALTLPIDAGSANQVLKNGSTAGQLEFGEPTVQPGQVIETIAGYCDGRQVTVGSGTYTLATATTPQQLTTSYADVTGSSLSYTAPSNAKVVIYDFQVQAGYVGGSSPLPSFRFYVDSTEVEVARTATYVYFDGSIRIRVILDVNNSSADVANAKIGTWSGAKTLKLQAREYGSGNEVKLHETFHFDGSGPNSQDSLPTLEITAIA